MVRLFSGEEIDEVKSEFWIVKDNDMMQQMELECHTLYDIRIKKNLSQSVTRDFTVSYQELEKKFGLDVSAANQSEKLMISSFLMQIAQLKMPTMDINRGDQEDSENEEQVLIDLAPIDTAAYRRALVDINGEKVPVTMELIGHSGKYYLGVKVTLFNQKELRDTGFFLLVDHKIWELTPEEKSSFRKKVKTNVDILR